MAPRRPKRRVVSRSFRIPPDVDRALEIVAEERRWSKSFLIRDILVGWLTYRKALKKIEGVDQGAVE
jgi:predicted transcriptional regulator